MAAKELVDKILKENKVAVFSKSYCPYCKMAKASLNETGVKYYLMEMEDRPDCDAIQNYLAQLTGGRTVPRVFIGGVCIGGGSETQEMQRSGELVAKLKEVGAL
ncbi:PREDICTED: glutaredoxin-1-like [Amphimedon queenslandica]|uniref:Glutaredoxin domain-containing protein n=1 Tax=Amphimedon queenslandica TaxID=400682 RepID=A0A1X7VTF3_AMPQE|nr:PREDICTED: glutaredoxin-1-like [Amphimedon queenslandica]|eukprot:XP_003383007.1 PREDICTED: glutaredoxin-1-like [Amphimedon queenslandica]